MHELGVSAIPSTFINGRLLTGAKPIAAFETLIDEQLALARRRLGTRGKPAEYYDIWAEKGA